MERVTAYELLHKHGGSWLGTCRNFIQRKFHNGSDVTNCVPEERDITLKVSKRELTDVLDALDASTIPADCTEDSRRYTERAKKLAEHIRNNLK